MRSYIFSAESNDISGDGSGFEESFHFLCIIIFKIRKDILK